ncbi:hypothetical protein ES708_32833 [subsurface metagenome]
MVVGGKRSWTVCKNCGWNGFRYHCPYGHNAYVCPVCGKGPIIELPISVEPNYPIFDEKTDEVYKP